MNNLKQGTLTLRFKAPMQRWGSDSDFAIRKTETLPTKNGVVGLIMAAFGVLREDQNVWLTKWKLEIETLQVSAINKGKFKIIPLKDFQMVNGTRRASGKMNPHGVLTWRYYLQDADFEVTLTGDSDFLTLVKTQLQNPKFPLYFGSKSCLPSAQILT